MLFITITASQRSRKITDEKKVLLLVRRGLFLREIAIRTGLSRTTIQGICTRAGVRYRNQKRTPEEIKAIKHAVTDEGMTFLEASQRLKIPKATVHRHVLIARGVTSRDPLGRVVGPGSVKRWRCPRHGWIKLARCVACEAEAARNQRSNRREIDQ